MPIYEYQCMECMSTFKVIHSMDDTQVNCILCDGEEIEKMIPKLHNNRKETVQRIGDVVKKHIREASNDVKEYKKQLRNKDIEDIS